MTPRLPIICVTDTSGLETEEETGLETEEETAENEILKQREVLADAIKHSVRDILRAFRQNPKAAQAILGK